LHVDEHETLGVIQLLCFGDHLLRTPTKTKARLKPPASPARVIARVAESPRPNIDDDAEDRQRVGVQSLGRAFAILEAVARHREGIGLADLSKRVGLHNSTDRKSVV